MVPTHVGREVLYVGRSGKALDVAREALDDEVDVSVAETTEAALDLLGSAACVVVTDSLGDEDPIEFVAAVRERDPDLPIVFYPEDGSEELAARATEAGATWYLPQRTGSSSLPQRVRDGIEMYEQARERRRDSDVLRSVFEGFPITMFVKDEEARHRVISELPDGRSRDEVIGKTDVDLYSDDDPIHARRTYEDDLEVIEMGKPIVEQEEKIDADDYTAWMETTKVPWRDEDGEIQGVVGISRDITERKEYEHELERERARSERFANYIAHDLRNPLNVARGYLDLARDADDVEPLDSIESSLDRMEEVIEDVLTLVGSEEEESTIEQVTLTDAIQGAWETVDEREATLAVDVPSGARLVAGRSHLQELFENLFRNAVEHGGSDVTVRVGLLEEGFFVEDDGRGIPTEERDSVLEYGYSGGEGGTGIGLAVVTELADVYEWSIDVRESDAGGARFEFRECLLVSDPSIGGRAGERIDLDRAADVGDVDVPGATEREGDAWVLRGSGRNVWRDTNEFHFAYAEVTGDVSITARLTELERVHEYTKAGVTIRNGLGDAEPLGYVGVTADHGSEVLWRPRETKGTGYVAIDYDAEPPAWLRAERVGEVVTLSVSGDGEEWSPIDQRRIDLADPVQVGLAVCSHRAGELAGARFDPVVVRELDPE